MIPTFQQHFNIQAGSQILDVGCAKGFMLHDMQVMIPGIEIQGIDVSNYAIKNAMDSVKPSLSVGCATKLPFPDNSFDLVISITTLHNLEIEDLATALREITRVSRGSSFITVDAYRDDDEKRRMEAWNLTAKTMMSVDEWKAFFAEIGYDGYYYWFIP